MNIKPEQIDALLPQTQCGLCGYAGCMPYAIALSEKAAPINQCPPGGIDGLLALANLLQEDPTPFIEELKTKHPSKAHIREAECIGCTKCIQACPVDAIVGSAKSMHTVLAFECTGCELCIPPCPVDCIEMEPIQALPALPDHFRKRFKARETRLNNEAKEQIKTKENPLLFDKKTYLDVALMRIQHKKKL